MNSIVATAAVVTAPALHVANPDSLDSASVIQQKMSFFTSETVEPVLNQAE